MPADTVTPARTPHIASRLPNVGTTIFTIMSALAQETRAVNLGQGFPDFDCANCQVHRVGRASISKPERSGRRCTTA